MRASAWACIGVVGMLVGAACGGAAFTASSTDGGTAGGKDGAAGGSGSGAGSGGTSGSGGGTGSSGGGTGSSGGGTGSSGGTGGSSGGVVDGGSSDGATTEGGSVCGTTPTRCGQTTCNGMNGQQGDVCCIQNGSTGPAFACAACTCGCATQLECAYSGDCGFPKVCCAVQSPCAGGSNHTVSTCQDRTSCLAASGKVLCNPGNTMTPECGTSTCSPNTNGIGIPANTGYGICN